MQQASRNPPIIQKLSASPSPKGYSQLLGVLVFARFKIQGSGMGQAQSGSGEVSWEGPALWGATRLGFLRAVKGLVYAE